MVFFLLAFFHFYVSVQTGKPEMPVYGLGNDIHGVKFKLSGSVLLI